MFKEKYWSKEFVESMKILDKKYPSDWKYKMEEMKIIFHVHK